MDTHTQTPTFNSEQDAWTWLYNSIEEREDECCDNFRFAYKNDPVAMDLYEGQVESGCCGFFDATIIVNGREATIGYNYGH